MRTARTETNFEKYLKEEYRKNPGMKRRVNEEKKKIEKEITFFNRIFVNWIEDLMGDEKFRKILEKIIALERKEEKRLLKIVRSAKRDIKEGRAIPHEEVKRRLKIKMPHQTHRQHEWHNEGYSGNSLA